jgi:hypothetical protein
MVQTISTNIYQLFYVPYIILLEVTLFSTDVLKYVGGIAWFLVSTWAPYLIYNYLNYIFFWARDVIEMIATGIVIFFKLAKYYIKESWDEIVYWTIVAYYEIIYFF